MEAKRWTSSEHLADRRLEVEGRNTDEEEDYEVRDEEHSAAVLVDEVGESPDAAITSCEAQYAE